MLRQILFLLIACSLSSFANDQSLAFFGTFTKKSGKGIYVSTFNSSTGKLSKPTLAAELSNPSFLAIDSKRKFLYAVSTNQGTQATISSFAVDKTGKLKKLSEQPTKGDNPCYVALDKTGQSLLVANYRGGNIASYPISNGKIGKGNFYQHKGSSIHPKRQTSPHPHSIYIGPNNEYVFVPDLGTDEIVIHKFDQQSSKLTPHEKFKAPAGTGPRHMAFHPNGKFAYSNLEISREVVAMSFDSSKGALKQLQVISTLPKGAEADGSTAESLVHPSGKWLYVSNRGHNSIAVFAIDQQTGKLTFLETESTKGEIPRGFGIDPSGKYIIAGHNKSEHITILKIDQKTGKLSPEPQGQVLNAVVNVRFLAK